MILQHVQNLTAIFFVHRPLYCTAGEYTSCHHISILVILLHFPKAPGLNEMALRMRCIKEPEKESQNGHICNACIFVSLNSMVCDVLCRKTSNRHQHIHVCLYDSCHYKQACSNDSFLFRWLYSLGETWDTLPWCCTSVVFNTSYKYKVEDTLENTSCSDTMM